ncbi:uncharacterized protein LOC117139937 [Drosophila mauritiana]|uniref:Uncharacterized protein LOC117139937 n=1 Tax=Drosophila mauritiana TaxID=7226 RepID=A0A6P8JQY0_DROMA|nr:uncharacterized protein LOC117139937 [Drosophila mauritiana]
MIAEKSSRPITKPFPLFKKPSILHLVESTQICLESFGEEFVKPGLQSRTNPRAKTPPIGFGNARSAGIKAVALSEHHSFVVRPLAAKDIEIENANAENTLD